MTHNCQTILHPCLTPVSHCTVPDRRSDAEEKRMVFRSVAEQRELDVLEAIREEPGISVVKIRELLHISESMASVTLTALRDTGRVERCRQGNGEYSPRHYYRIKEYLQ